MDVLHSLRRFSNNFALSSAPVDANGDHVVHPGVLANAIDQIEGLVKVGSAVSLRDLPAYIDAIRNLKGQGLDDRKLLLMKLHVLLASLPPGSEISNKLPDFFIDTLYKDLAHPPTSYLSKNRRALPPDGPDVAERTYLYRSANATGYNVALPTLGAAGGPYSRTVQTASIFPPSALPDPGLVFDLLLARPPGKFVKHPGGLNAMFFAVANLVIHSVFDTNRKDWNINDASSYLDLDPLYGNDMSVMKKKPGEVRMNDGTGHLKDDAFADQRLRFMPPATAVLVILLSRNHNYIADKILQINEKGSFSNPPPEDPKKRQAQDDEIYEKARLVNCMTFAKLAMHDYVGGFMGMRRDGSSFTLLLNKTIREDDHAFAPTGQGNQISAEFNLLYRWHATTSEKDEEWISAEFERMSEKIDNKPVSKWTPGDFAKASMEDLHPKFLDPVEQWDIGSLKRDLTTGRFRDEDLANVIKNAIEEPAHAYGARKTPQALRVIEIMAIEQARKWGVCTLNEFRKFFGLKQYASFKEWNPDQSVCDAAEELYRDINNLELHVGLQAEETIPLVPGLALCSGYSMSRSILADAVSLVRSDPYLTTEFNPSNCTGWGYQDCAVNEDDGSHGGMFTKLLFRTLPGQFASGDAYAHFPLVLPSVIKDSMVKRGDPTLNAYSWARPSPAVASQGAPGAQATIRIEKLVNSKLIHGSTIVDVLVDYANDSMMRPELITKNSITWPSVGVPVVKQIDIIQDFLNLVPVYFLGLDILGLPLKTDEHPRGLYRPQAMYDMFENVGKYALFNLDATDEWYMRSKAVECAADLVRQIKSNLESQSAGYFSGWYNWYNDRSSPFLKSLLDVVEKGDVSQDAASIAASLFVELIPSAVQYSAALAHVVDYYLEENSDDKTYHETLSEGQKQDRVAFYSAVKSTEPSSGAQVMAFARSALRTSFDATSDVIDYSHGLMNPAFSDKTVPLILRTIFGLKNVRRAPGKSGQVVKSHGPGPTFYLNNRSGISPWPTGLIIQYDE